MSPNRRLPLQLRVALAFAVTTALALTALGVFLHLRVGATLESQIRDGVSSSSTPSSGCRRPSSSAPCKS